MKLRITKGVAKAARAGAEKAARAMALEAIRIIRERTGRGVDADGHAFVAYSDEYRRLKSESGRSGSPPDLTLSGAMLNNLKLKRIKWRGNVPVPVIGFDGMHARRSFRRRRGRVTLAAGRSADVSMATIVRANDERRRFFALRHAAEVARLKVVFTTIFNRELANLMKR